MKRYTPQVDPEYIHEDPQGEFYRVEDVEAMMEELGGIAKSASNELFKLIESMKPRPIDTAPKDGLYILGIYNPDGGSALIKAISCRWDDELSGWFGFDGIRTALTHWLPLPPEVKPWSDSPEHDKFIEMESKEDK